MEKSSFEKRGGTYTEVNGVLIPNLIVGGTNYKIGLWGQWHEAYLKEHEKSHYTTLLTTGKLNAYLHEVDLRATKMYETLIKQLAEKQGITEKLKADDMMAWVGAMNNICGCANEIVLKNIIFV